MSKMNRLLITAAVLILAAIVLLLGFVGSTDRNKVKIGLVMTGSVSDEGWNGMHYSGVVSACEKTDVKLLVQENVLEGTGECIDAIHALAGKGVNMIILSSYGYPAEAQEVIAQYPDIEFYANSSDITADNLSSYFGRMYQVRYLAGIVAGMQSATGSIGYVAAMPNSEVNRGINAFTLGVRSVAPDAVVNVRWTDTWDDEDTEAAATQKLIDECGVDVITYHQNQHSVARTADAAGVMSIGYNTAAQGLSDKFLTAAVWNWDSVYYEIIREFVQGEAGKGHRHWLGIDRGVAELSEYSPIVTEDTRAAVEAARADILAGRDVFTGEIYDNNGTLRCGEGERMADDTLFSDFDWYVDGVVINE